MGRPRCGAFSPRNNWPNSIRRLKILGAGLRRVTIDRAIGYLPSLNAATSSF